MNAQHWIDIFRVETAGRLDIAATAAKVGVPVLYEMPGSKNGRFTIVQGCVEGLSGDKPVAVHLNPTLSRQDYQVTFGHELGHIFIETAAGIVVKQRRDDVERLCDFIGRQMALPLADIAHIEVFDTQVVPALMQQYNVTHMTVIHQLMLAGKLSRRIAIDTNIGEVKNPFYANKVSRHIVCIDCELEKSHEPVMNVIDMPQYDFTAYDWSDDTPWTDCNGSSLDTIDEHIALNKAYGRWTDADEALIQQERERSHKLRLIAAKYAYSHVFDYEQDELF